MRSKINDIKVQLNHRTDDRFTATIKLIGYNAKDMHLTAYFLQQGIPDGVTELVGQELDRKLADFYLGRQDG